MSNPHIKTAEFRLNGVHDWQSEEGATDATMITVALDAQVEATLALAYEQRTANLLAFAQPLDLTDGAKLVATVEMAIKIRNEVGERLGLKP